MYFIFRIKKNILSAAALVALLLVFGTAAYANVTASPTAVSFGTQSVGKASAPVEVILTNTDRAAIKIKKASVATNQFFYSGPSLPVTLDHGQSLTAYVTFLPSAAKAYSGTLIFERANGSTISVSLSGSGVPTQGTSPVTPPVTPLLPTITTQPSRQTVTAGQTATFNVAATGTAPMTYQWNQNGAAISGATSSSYTTPAETTTNNNAQFTVTVSNSAGSATSNVATLTVNAAVIAPAITTQPSRQTVTAGQTATFNVAATGTAPMTYQWNQNGAAISGATSSSYTTPAETTTNNNAQFTVTVSNSAGSATSNAATLTVNAGTLVLSASSTALSFGNVAVSSSGNQTVTLTNTGNSTITISNTSISGAGFAASGVPTGTILTAGQTATLNVTFSPAATGSVIGSVTVTSNATNSPATISLSGSGTAATTYSAVLTWTASSSSVVGYNIYSSTVSGSSYTLLNATPVSATTFTDTTVEPGQTYYYVVTAVNSTNVDSSYSNQVTAIIP